MRKGIAASGNMHGGQIGNRASSVQFEKPSFAFLQSEKNKYMLSDADGYLYWKYQNRGDRIYWRCIFFQAGADGEKGSKCSGKVITESDKIWVTAGHNHLEDPTRVELKNLQGGVQKKAVESKEPRPSIIGSSLADVSKEAGALARRSYMARNIRKIRHEANFEPSKPKTLKELIVPDGMSMLGEEIFLKFDGRNGDERVLIFSTERCLDLLQAVPKWGADGTFDVASLLFDQMWVIFVRLAHSYVPVVYCLPNRRLQSSYEFFLNRLKEMRPKLEPISVAVDFEKAEFNAFQKMFPNTANKCCSRGFWKDKRRKIRSTQRK